MLKRKSPGSPHPPKNVREFIINSKYLRAVANIVKMLKKTQKGSRACKGWLRLYKYSHNVKM